MSVAERVALLLCVAVVARTGAELTTCQQIEQAFKSVAEANDSETCSCAYEDTFNTVDGMSLGCSSSSVSLIFVALRSLNDTSIGSLRIRDSLVNILPTDIFAHVKPRQLAIERCSLSIVRNNSIGSIGPRLRRLSLRNNKLKKLDRQLFDGLTRLQYLDVSGNKISSIDADTFAKCKEVTEFIANNNELTHIEDGTFSSMSNLKTLSLIGNKITTITKNTFKGLDHLEVLQLQDNEISEVDWAAFANMKNLRTLNIGTNHVSMVELRGLDNLQKLLLNNNSIDSLKSISLRDLPSLTLVSLDRNRITSIDNVDLFGLSRSTRLESLTFASNNISHIGPRAFQSVQNLQALSLQHNQISDLSTNGTAYLMPLKRLTSLQMSNNQLIVIRSQELPLTLTHLAVDHNQISRIEPRAFEGIALKRIYLNKNKLQFLYQNAFASFPPSTIEAIDVSSNNWQCVCKNPSEWLPRWLEEAEESDVSDGPLGCLAIPDCGKEQTEKMDTEEKTTRSAWITVAATGLAAVSLLILIAIVVLYLKDGSNRIMMRPLSRRVDSDLHKLIDNDPLVISPSAPDDGLLEKKVTSPTGEKKKVRFEDY